MEKSTSASERFVEISRILETEVKFDQDPDDPQKASPVIDVRSLLSKLVALMVYSGWNVPAASMPSYTSVHADVEYWKRIFEQKAEESPFQPAGG